MRRTPLFLLLAMTVTLGSGCHARSTACCPDTNGSMTISQGGNDVGGALVGVALYITLQMIFNSAR